jgi:hypothetical protein
MMPIAIGWYVYTHVLTVPNDKVTTIPLPPPTVQGDPNTVIKSGPNELKSIALRGGSRAVLRPNTSFSYSYILTPGFTVVEASLQGEASIELKGAERHMRLRTGAGIAQLTQGTYAIRCEPGCANMLLTVGIGFATLRADTGQSTVELKAGEKGRQPKGAPAERVWPGTGWPELIPAFPEQR